MSVYQGEEPKRPAAEWCQRLGVDILDPDGWRLNDGVSWGDAITVEEFGWRTSLSTQRFTPKVGWTTP